MRTPEQVRDVLSSGVLSRVHFGISVTDQAHILNILRDRIYTNKIDAVVREYSVNARDEHVKMGRPELPIEVRLPTTLDSAFVVRDFGPGLSPEAVKTIYVMYGASLNRDSDDANGSWGLGAKAGFAYNDMFNITSWHGGKKRIYHAYIDKTNLGCCDLMYEEDCGDETGVEVKVPVRPQDAMAFVQSAQKYFPFFEVMPKCNHPISALPEEMRAGDYARRDGSALEQVGHFTWVAVMGGVVYPIALDQLREALKDEGLDAFVDRLRGILRFDIGGIDPAVSREGLEFTEKTKAAVVTKFKQVRVDITATAVKRMGDEKNSFNLWLLVRDYVAEYGVAPPGEFAKFKHDKVPLYTLTKEQIDDHAIVPRTFRFAQLIRVRHQGRDRFSSRPMQYLTPSSDVRIWVMDTRKSLTGYFRKVEGSAVEKHYLVVPRGISELNTKKRMQAAVEEVEAELTQLLEEANLTGVPVARLSTRAYEAYHTSSSPRSVKHLTQYFTLSPSASSYGDLSSLDWDIADREPTASDITVVIDRFRIVNGSWGFVNGIRQDQRLFAEVFDFKDFPPIFGVKSTSKNPVTPATKIGIDYPTWRDAKRKELIANATGLNLLVETSEWANVKFDAYQISLSAPEFLHAKEQLGEDHPLVAFVERVFTARRVMETTLKDKHSALTYLQEYMQVPSVVLPAREKLECAYPHMIERCGGPGLFAPFTTMRAPGLSYSSELKRGVLARTWVQYVLMADAASRMEIAARKVAQGEAKSEIETSEIEMNDGKEEEAA